MRQLDLKYRPRHFSEILGNTGVIKLLLKRSQDRTLSGQSMMLGGPKGCGKTSIARLIAMAVACPNLKDGEPCGECEHCSNVHVGSSQEVEEFDAASHGTVERARALVADADYESLTGGPRVHIMDEAHGLSKQAQGALLKAVEDRTVVLILCTTEPHKILTAIRSRVEEYPVSCPAPEIVIDWLYSICRKEAITASVDALELIVRANECCPRSCVLALDRASVLGPVTIPSVREIFRYGSLESIVQVLDGLDTNLPKMMSDLDSLMALEGPTWTRDNLVAAITSAIRGSIGAKTTFLVPTGFFPRRGRAWADVARALSSLDRPTFADVEAVLLSFSSLVPVLSSSLVSPSLPQMSTPVAPPPPAVATREPILVALPAIAAASLSPPSLVAKPEKPAPKPPRTKGVEIDGVKYHASEKLTTLDDKVIPSQKKEDSTKKPVPTTSVEFGEDHAPIPLRTFASSLINRVKGNG